MDVWRLQSSFQEDRDCLVCGGEDLQPGDDGCRVDEGVLEVGVAGEELRLQVPRVGDALEEGDVDAVRGRHVLEGDGLEQRHCRGMSGNVELEFLPLSASIWAQIAGVCRELVKLPPSQSEVIASWCGAAPTWCQLQLPCLGLYVCDETQALF